MSSSVTVLGWVFGAAGLMLLAAWIRGDRARGRRRCPQCWYDMAGVQELRCPECGREWASDRALHQTRRSRWRLGVVLAVLALAAGCFWMRSRSMWRLVPTPILVRVAPVGPSAWKTQSGTWALASGIDLAGVLGNIGTPLPPAIIGPDHPALVELYRRDRTKWGISTWRVFFDRLIKADPKIPASELAVETSTLDPTQCIVRHGAFRPYWGGDWPLYSRIRATGGGAWQIGREKDRTTHVWFKGTQTIDLEIELWNGHPSQPWSARVWSGFATQVPVVSATPSSERAFNVLDDP